MVVNQLLPIDALYHLPTILYQIIGSITPNISLNFILNTLHNLIYLF